MRLKIAIIISSVAIALLIVYGFDVLIGYNLGQGFLPINAAVRGFALGLPAIVLPVIAYFITRKKRSKLLGFLILTSGVLTLSGSIEFLLTLDISGMSRTEMIMERIQSFGPIMIFGGFISFLGLFKILKN